ncbi:hypothetical protein CHU98_g10158 [Xylaria longipes]|nr:hypothetical protein CHU98_g10158 [Xylaria longipes]
MKDAALDSINVGMSHSTSQRVIDPRLAKSGHLWGYGPDGYTAVGLYPAIDTPRFMKPSIRSDTVPPSSTSQPVGCYPVVNSALSTVGHVGMQRVRPIGININILRQVASITFDVATSGLGLGSGGSEGLKLSHVGYANYELRVWHKTGPIIRKWELSGA